MIRQLLDAVTCCPVGHATQQGKSDVGSRNAPPVKYRCRDDLSKDLINLDSRHTLNKNMIAACSPKSHVMSLSGTSLQQSVA